MDIKCIIMDIDGTLTDGKIYFGNSGEAFKAFNVKDGLAIIKLKPLGITPIIITGRTSEIVTRRALELGLADIYQGVSNKVLLLPTICNKYNIKSENIAYIGDDLIDYKIMKDCGFAACPSDAVEDIKNISHYISPFKSGEAAVRDIIEYILKCQDQWIDFLNLFE